MAEYQPLYAPGQAITCRTSADVVGGKLLAVSGDGTVATCPADSAAWVGTAAFDALSGTDVTVHCGGVQRFTASGGITAGAAVVSGAAGTVKTIGAETNYSRVVGLALTTALDTATVTVAMVR